MLKFYSLLAILLIGFAPNINSRSKTLSHRIDSLINTVTAKPFNGIIMVGKEGRIVYSRRKGYSDIVGKTKFLYDHQFVIASVSKQMTAALILVEYEKGTLKLDNPVSAYLPHLTQSWKHEVTIDHLLTHMHGIRDLEQPLAFPAGSQFEYSQIGYELLAMILEKVTGKTFVNLSDALFDKCIMKNTAHPLSGRIKKQPIGYTEDSKGNIVLEEETPKYVAAGGFISTTNDLLRWNSYLYGGKLFSKETLRLMTIPKKGAVREHPIFGTTRYGYGITISDANNFLQFGQTGYVPGFVSMSFYFPETKTSVIVLENIVYDVDDIKKTFYYHTHILDIVRDYLLNNKK